MRWLRRFIRPVDPSAASEPVASSVNHIIRARHEFSNAFGDLARGKRNWQVIAFVLAGLSLFVTIAYVRLASSGRFIPYVIQVDRLGQVAAAGVLSPLKTPDQRLIASQLSQFIRNIRTVLPTDAAPAQAELLRHGYTFVGQEAAAFLNEYFSHPENDPRLLGARLTRLVDVSSVLRVPNSEVWKLRWSETERPVLGIARTRAWEAYVTVKLTPPATADAIEDNPLGLYIASITWAQVAETSGASLRRGGSP